MFFVLSKLFWVVFQPLNFLILMLLVSLIGRKLGGIRLAKYTSRFAVVCLILIGFTQFADLPLRWLENRFEVPEITEPPYGIIILGGSLSTSRVDPRAPYHIFDSAERVIKGFALKRRFPVARLIYSGGDSSLTQWDLPESDAALALANDLYGETFPMEAEPKSRTTWENAINVSDMLSPEDRSKTWILVTTAAHMTRAMGAFRKAGMEPVAYPSDFRAANFQFPYLTSRTVTQFNKLEIFAKELFGTLAYWATGKFSTKADNNG